MSVERIVKRVLGNVVGAANKPASAPLPLVAALEQELDALDEEDRKLLMQHLEAMCTGQDAIFTAEEERRSQ